MVSVEEAIGRGQYELEERRMTFRQSQRLGSSGNASSPKRRRADRKGDRREGWRTKNEINLRGITRSLTRNCCGFELKAALQGFLHQAGVGRLRVRLDRRVRAG